MEVLEAALKAADPYTAVRDALLATDIECSGKIYVVGAGKAGAAMSRAVEEVLGDRIARGLVVIKDGHAANEETSLRYIELTEASHPLPDHRGVEASDRIMAIAAQACSEDLIICLISGGGSALLTAPRSGITLEELQSTTRLLLHSGATINEMNAVRKHLSAISGGQLAQAASPARLLALIISDVTGSPLDVIASGPTTPDPTTYRDALNVLERYSIVSQVPAAVLTMLRRGAAGELSETPKPGDELFKRVENRVVADNVLAVEAAIARAHVLGLHSIIMSTYLEGEAREVGIVLASIAKEVKTHGRPVQPPGCVIFGGETTVTVKGQGVGGRNTELALGAALALEGWGPDTIVASLATDGGDGASPGAGAIADGTSVERGRAIGLDAVAHLKNNDSYPFWSALGDAIHTGPTGTNVNDVMAVFVF